MIILRLATESKWILCTETVASSPQVCTLTYLNLNVLWEQKMYFLRHNEIGFAYYINKTTPQ